MAVLAGAIGGDLNLTPFWDSRRRRCSLRFVAVVVFSDFDVVDFVFSESLAGLLLDGGGGLFFESFAGILLDGGGGLRCG